MITAVVMADGRADCLSKTLDSFESMVAGSFSRVIIHDDSGDPEYRAHLKKEYGHTHEIVVSSPQRMGFGRSIALMWDKLRFGKDPYVFWLEDDFVFNRPVDLDLVALVLEIAPHLSQLAFRRQAWSPEEVAKGGFMETREKGTYVERESQGWTWVEHSVNWTTNPHLMRREVTQMGWPISRESEGHFGFKLKAKGLPWGIRGEDVRFGFVGGMEEGRDWVTHIGEQRVGKGY